MITSSEILPSEEMLIRSAVAHAQSLVQQCRDQVRIYTGFRAGRFVAWVRQAMDGPPDNADSWKLRRVIHFTSDS